LNWLVNLEETLRVDADEHDLLELAGIIIENASQWAAQQIEVGCSRLDDRAEFIVEDDGVGVSDEDIAKLGIRGTRLDENSPGDGLGLAIAYEIVRLNRGSVDATRGRSGGLRISICLPLVGTQADVAAAPKSAVTPS
jgi:signal transduction histidine kinase